MKKKRVGGKLDIQSLSKVLKSTRENRFATVQNPSTTVYALANIDEGALLLT